MKKVLLLNPPGKELYLRDQHCSSSSKADYYWPPIDLIMLSGIISVEHEVQVMDAIIDNLKEEECLRLIKKDCPDFIIFLTGIVSWLGDFDFMQKVKASTGAIVIATGGFLLDQYQQVMERFTFLDAIIMDYTSDSIIQFLRGERDNLVDICYRDNATIVKKPKSNLKEFSIPVPRHELFKLEKYRIPHGKYKPFSSVLTNYGCPYQCSYCIAENIDFKYRPVENIIPELEKLKSLGVKEIFFKDFTFGVPNAVTKRLCEELTSNFPGMSWICSSRVNTLDENLLKLMKKAGCHTIQFGVESASQLLLDENNKKITVENIITTFDLCNKIGIRTLAHFILGLPGETEATIYDTIKFAKKLKCDYASFNVVTPTIGTTLRKRCLENGWIADNDEELDSSRGFPVIETAHLSRLSLWKLRNYAIRSFYLRPGFILNKLIGIRSIKDLIFLFKEGIALLGSIKNKGE